MADTENDTTPKFEDTTPDEVRASELFRHYHTRVFNTRSFGRVAAMLALVPGAEPDQTLLAIVMRYWQLDENGQVIGPKTFAYVNADAQLVCQLMLSLDNVLVEYACQRATGEDPEAAEAFDGWDIHTSPVIEHDTIN